MPDPIRESLATAALRCTHVDAPGPAIKTMAFLCHECAASAVESLASPVGSRNPADIIADLTGEDPNEPNIVAAREFCAEPVAGRPTMPDPTPADHERARAIAGSCVYKAPCERYIRHPKKVCDPCKQTTLIAAALAEQRDGANERFVRVMGRLRALGVSYRENYGGPFELQFPHSAYLFTIWTDRHGISVKMMDCASDSEPIELAFCPPRPDNDLAVEIVEALEAAEAAIRATKRI